MSKGGEAGQQGDGGEAGEQAEQAKKDLDEAQEQLAERRQQAEMDLAREQIAKMQDGLKSLGEQQQSLLAETERLESLRSAQGRFTRPQIISVRDLGRAERGLEAESKALAEKVASAEVFHLALETIAARNGAGLPSGIERQETGESDATDRTRRRSAASINCSKPSNRPRNREERGSQAGRGGPAKCCRPGFDSRPGRGETAKIDAGGCERPIPTTGRRTRHNFRATSRPRVRSPKRRTR